MAPRKKTLRRRALRLDQNAEHPLYLFALTGEELLQIADISRVSRDDAGKLIGYQRPEVKRHVKDIVDYLNQDGIVFPNSLILALPSDVLFKKSRGPQIENGSVSAGVLEISLPKNGGVKPAWIVDGQQRALAISKSTRRNTPYPVSAFVADDIELQRDQFLRVNNTKPLPRGLITELLPEVSTILPAKLAARKIPSALCEQLNSEPSSPFHGLIRRASTPRGEKKKAVITDTSIIKMIQDSITSPNGVLFPYRILTTGETDFESIWKILHTYWHAIETVFPDAWGLPATKSRLMHGAGIRAMGRLMDHIMPSVDVESARAQKTVEKELRLLKPVCRWTSGNWDDLDGLPWNDLQNTPRHVRLLSNVLLRSYLQARSSRR